MHSEVLVSVAKANRAFGCLQSAVFQNQNINVATRREVYRSVVLFTLLYGAETWTVTWTVLVTYEEDEGVSLYNYH